MRALKKRGYDDKRIRSYVSRCNLLPNLELLTDSENVAKNAAPFDAWLTTRDKAFRSRHLIPDLPSLGFDSFGEFFEARSSAIKDSLRSLRS